MIFVHFQHLVSLLDTRFGPRFPPMNRAYDAQMKQYAHQIGRELGIEHQMHEGVYTCLGGPNYETVAELRMLKILGKYMSRNSCVVIEVKMNSAAKCIDK